MKPRAIAAALSLALWLALVPRAAAAQDEGGAEVRAGELRIIHLWSVDPDAFLAQWNQPDPPPYGDPIAFDALPLSPPVAQGFGVAPNSIALVIEDGEQLGDYTVQLDVTDEIAGVTASQTTVLEIVEAD